MRAAIGPRFVERPSDGGAVPIAVLDAASVFLVDGGGLVQPPGEGWALDWWIGADDRWYLPAREPSVRQRRRGFGPVIETAVRVPSGDVLQTVYATMVAGRQVCVVEFDNQSPVPVALAMAIRPYDLSGAEHQCSMQWRSKVLLDLGSCGLTLPRPPSEKAFSAKEDLLAAVEAGRDLLWDSTEPDAVLGDGEFTNGLVLYPLPHRTSIRVALGPTELSVDLAALAGPDQVARGWDTMIERTGRFEFADPGLTKAAGAARARLLLATDLRATSTLDLGRLSQSLATSGHFDRLKQLLTGDGLADVGLVERVVAGVSTLGAKDPTGSATLVDHLARAAVILGDRSLGKELLEPLAWLTKKLEPGSRWGFGGDPVAATAHWVRAAGGLLALVEWLGQADAANDLRQRLAQQAPPWGQMAPTYDEVTDLVQLPVRDSTGAGRGSVDGVVQAADLWTAARGLVIKELILEPEPTIELLPDYPTAWRGGSTEIHQAATLYGPLSYAVRWHGPRPALLWDRRECAARLVSPGLDPDWIGESPQGEALLAGSAEGLGVVPSPGDSFA